MSARARDESSLEHAARAAREQHRAALRVHDAAKAAWLASGTTGAGMETCDPALAAEVDAAYEGVAAARITRRRLHRLAFGLAAAALLDGEVA